MKIIFLFCIITFLCYGANGLKCIWCTNPLDKYCTVKKLADCDSDDDYCVDIVYGEKMFLWKQCISKDAVDDCLQKIDGTYCTVCQKDGCNNLSTQNFIEVLEEAKIGDILEPIFEKKRKENEH